MKKTGIIGGGFSGTMTAVHLIEGSAVPMEIIIFNEGENFSRGIAFNPYSKLHLLNVPAFSMSALPGKDSHFIDWLMKQPEFLNRNRSIAGNSFVPRRFYGEYLSAIWEHALHTAKAKKIAVRLVTATVTDITIAEDLITLKLNNEEQIAVDHCIIASGNNVPRNPGISNSNFLKSKNYFQNPWEIRSVSELDTEKPVLIIGNGLTMVDTVLGLLEKKIKAPIYSISPNGFNILPHRHGGLKYTGLVNELPENPRLRELVSLLNKHIKLLKYSGISAEPVIDSLRPYTQKIWQQFSEDEKRIFMRRFRHMWGIVRSRIPSHIHDTLQQLRIDNKLHMYAGRIINITEEAGDVTVEFFNRDKQANEILHVARVINCTGPEADLMRIENSFLKNCIVKGIAVQDPLKLGIDADPETFAVIDRQGNKHKNLFTLGTNLKGVLWESIAVNELKEQARNLARQVLSQS